MADTLPKITLDQAQERSAAPLDEARIVPLASAIMRLVRDHMAVETLSHPVTLEALNALAVNVGILLAGTGNDARAREFFDSAVAHQLQDMAGAAQ